MATFNVEIELDNDAFLEDETGELTKIFQKLIVYLKNGDDTGQLMDSNGNVCGEFWFDENDGEDTDE